MGEHLVCAYVSQKGSILRGFKARNSNRILEFLYSRVISDLRPRLPPPHSPPQASAGGSHTRLWGRGLGDPNHTTEQWTETLVLYTFILLRK